MDSVNNFLSTLAAIIWWPVLILIIGGGIFFLLYSRFIQYKYFVHAIQVLRGKYEDPNAPGQISPYKALSTALASTVGMGNLSGVAAAIALGGPGALFWMWVTAIIGMSTNFFSNTLSSLYRGKDSTGELQGGPMYVIREGLSKKYHSLAYMFCVCCLIGCLPIFQANQLTQALVDIGLKPMGMTEEMLVIGNTSISITKFAIGVFMTILVSIVILGGIQRISTWSARLVPVMIIIHFVSVVFILVAFSHNLPYYIKLVFTDAFAADHYYGDPFFGGITGGLIMLGVRRATFSNEAGIGTGPMAMGASKSHEPVRVGLISMLSPAIDTLFSCSLTAFSILVTDVWLEKNTSGITLTAKAYKAALPQGGEYILLLCTIVFAVSSLFSYCYYGRKAFAFLAGESRTKWYDYFYLSTIVLGAIASMDLILNVIDISFALMAIPTMIVSIKLAPKVMEEANKYFARLKNKQLN